MKWITFKLGSVLCSFMGNLCVKSPNSCLCRNDDVLLKMHNYGGIEVMKLPSTYGLQSYMPALSFTMNLPVSKDNVSRFNR